MATASLIHMVAHYKATIQECRKLGRNDLAEIGEAVLRLIDAGVLKTRDQAIRYEEREIALMKRNGEQQHGRPD